MAESLRPAVDSDLKIRIESDGLVHNTRLLTESGEDLVVRRATVHLEPAEGVVYADVVLDEIEVAISLAEARVYVGSSRLADVIAEGLSADLECAHSCGTSLCVDCRARHIVHLLILKRSELAR